MPPFQPPETSKSTEGMVDYDRNSYQQGLIVAGGARWIRDLVPKIGVMTPEFRMVDYGCGPGGTAIETVRPAVEAFRALSAAAPIAITHADQPGNDWNALFALVAGPDGYGRADPNLRTEASVGSFYEAMAAPGSVSLGTCFTSTHWLSRAVRLESPGAVIHAELPEAARAELAALAEADWQRFLRHRAAEIRPGGYLIVIGIGAVRDQSRPHGVAITSQGLYRAVGVVAKGLADDGYLDRKVLDRFVFPNWFRTVEQTRRPLEREPDLRAAFDIVEASAEPATVNPKDVYAGDLADPDRYSERYVGFLRGFGDSTLRSQLFRPAAKDERKVDTLTEEFYRRFGRLYRKSPGTYATETWVSTLILRRR